MADITITIRCMYSCNFCGIHKAVVEVQARRDGEDVARWIKQVAAVALSEDHSLRSPTCHPATLSEVYIPIDGAKFIGGAIEQ
jgi:hypothetical protein